MFIEHLDILLFEVSVQDFLLILCQIVLLYYWFVSVLYIFWIWVCCHMYILWLSSMSLWVIFYSVNDAIEDVQVPFVNQGNSAIFLWLVLFVPPLRTVAYLNIIKIFFVCLKISLFHPSYSYIINLRLIFVHGIR